MVKYYTIKELDQLPPEVKDMINQGHINDEAMHGIVCNYRTRTIVAKTSNGKIIGALQAYMAFAEVYVDDIWVQPAHRGNNVGRRLLEELENTSKGKGYNNINLVTSAFQAPEFYKKCGFEVEFIRINKQNPKLNKIFFIKYFDEEDQHQGLIRK